MRASVDISAARGNVWAVLAAAGGGERLGADRPKAFARLGHLPLLATPLARLDDSPWIDGIVIVAPPGWEEPAILLAEELGAGKVAACVAGGGARADSVRAGLHDVPGDALVVLVHDAARPLLSDEVIERLLTALGDGWDGVVPALPVADTIRRAHDGEAGETIGREGLISVQTPQAFAADALRRAFADRDVDAPDCAAVVQRAGGRVRIVEGEPRLLKVTTPADLELVASLL